MTYTTPEKVRTLLNLGTADVSNSALIELIEIADSKIDSETSKSFSSGQKEMASLYKSAELLLRRVLSESSQETPSYSISGIKIDKESANELTAGQIKDFEKKYNKLMRETVTKEVIKKSG